MRQCPKSYMFEFIVFLLVGCYTKGKGPSMSNYLSIAYLSQCIWLLCGIRKFSSRIWTRISVSLSEGVDHYTKIAFLYIYINLGKIPQKRMEYFRLLLDHPAWIEHQFLSGIRDSRKARSPWGMMRGVGGVRSNEVNTPDLIGQRIRVRVRTTMLRF